MLNKGKKLHWWLSERLFSRCALTKCRGAYFTKFRSLPKCLVQTIGYFTAVYTTKWVLITLAVSGTGTEAWMNGLYGFM